MTRIVQLALGLGVLALACAGRAGGPASTGQSPAASTAQANDYQVYAEPPRLLLAGRRLRLLKRERERKSMRWEQFSALIDGHARMPEPGFAYALYGAAADSKSSCGEALAWALKTASAQKPGDLRQMALVYDWCKPQFDAASAASLEKLLLPALKLRPRSAVEVRGAVFAAIAVSDADPAAAESLLRYAVEDWWRKQTLPRLRAGEDPFPRRASLLALLEIAHVLRDNLSVDLREDAPKWFEELPMRLMLAYYPAPWPAAENEYRIPAYVGSGDPDLEESVSSRVAEMALVASDPNAQSTQFLQGWLMQDRFLMRSPLGAPYEFLWANPYLPGLSFDYMPDLYHAQGRLFVRSSWDENAVWFGLWDHEMQLYRDGQRFAITQQAGHASIDLGPVRVFFGGALTRFETGWWMRPDEDTKAVEQVAFVVGLQPAATYDVEVDGEEMDDAETDSAGILELHFPPDHKAGVRLHKAAKP
ncbi:MAG: hypothetical protein P4K98_08900 [Bryobacteraceae bacterium]|nr:hypothetical protein [Bryobacteraceae bacterium]